MLVAFCGLPGSGKTLSMSALGVLCSLRFGVGLYANYDLQNAFRLRTYEGLMSVEDGIACLDEAHLFLDSRSFKGKKQIQLTHLLAFSRHKNIVVFYSTQVINQVDIRLRQLTDVMCWCTHDRKRHRFYLDVFAYQFNSDEMPNGLPLRRFVMSSPARYFGLYDAYSRDMPLLLTALEHAQVNGLPRPINEVTGQIVLGV